MDISFKVIADHIRSLAFAIGDGALPSNEGRGYVLRRLLRRAVMHGKKLGIDQAFLYKLVPVVGEIMVSYYPEVKQQEAFIEKVVRTEEERFHETINDGLSMLNDVLAELKAKNETTLDGKVIFKLIDRESIRNVCTINHLAATILALYHAYVYSFWVDAFCLEWRGSVLYGTTM